MDKSVLMGKLRSNKHLGSISDVSLFGSSPGKSKQKTDASAYNKRHSTLVLNSPTSPVRGSKLGKDLFHSGLATLPRNASVGSLLDELRNDDSLPSVPQTKSSVPPGFARNELWNNVQSSLVSVFQGNQLILGKLSELHDDLSILAKSEVGRFIYEYYESKLLPKGMRILRKDVKGLEGWKLLHEMVKLWDYFFKEVLPTVLAILLPIPRESHRQPIRNLTLLKFRDMVVLDSTLEAAVQTGTEEEIPPAIRQMLLVLQGVSEHFPPSPRDIQLERLAARVINPLLGACGLYTGSPDPEVKAAVCPSPSDLQRIKSRDFLDPPARLSISPEARADWRHMASSPVLAYGATSGARGDEAKPVTSGSAPLLESLESPETPPIYASTPTPAELVRSRVRRHIRQASNPILLDTLPLRQDGQKQQREGEKQAHFELAGTASEAGSLA